ncbi:MAG: phosphatidate cytidylyltransferase [Oscillospiraceae bacterium]|nr:phosphatidate cytidylyltransferase [Oscillospiraceae bacterium]
MNKRYISAAVGLALLAVAICYVDLIAFDVVLAVIGVLALYESVRAFLGHIRLIVLIPCSLMLVALMFTGIQWITAVMALLFILFCGMMMSKKRIKFRDAAAIFLITAMLSCGFLSAVSLRDMGLTVWDKRILIIFGLGFGWICDTFAYTFGNLFGKRKLAPEISPNKTIEGAVGGILSTMVLSVGIYLLYIGVCSPSSVFYMKNDMPHLIFIATAGLIGGVVGVIGDLSVSYIKRQCGIKDFGNIMPGHGGALDRVDSILFTSAFAYLAFGIFFGIL